jgi:hypothetical protein
MGVIPFWKDNKIGMGDYEQPLASRIPILPDCVLYHDYFSKTGHDYSQYGNDGTINGPALGNTGLVFDGTNGKNVTVTPAISIQFGVSDFAYFFWANLTNNGAAQYLCFLRWGPRQVEFKVDFSAGTLAAEYWGSGLPQEYYKITETPVSMTGWHLFGYEIDRDVGAVISVDGIGLHTLAGLLRTSAAGDFDSLYVGSLFNGTLSLSGILGETIWFNAYGTYSGMNRAQLYDTTKARYGL